jgi:multidrug resistance efflux pump
MVQPTGTGAQRSLPDAPIATEAKPAAPPPRPPKRGTFRKWRARLIVLLLLAAAVVAFLQISGGRVTQAARIDLTTVTLTAQPIAIQTPLPGPVTSVAVTAQQHVKKGAKLGTIDVTTTNSQGKQVVTEEILTAPQAGIVIDDPLPVGSTLQPGIPFLELYDPAKMTFVTNVKLPNVPELGRGMVASLKAEGFNRTIKATVERVVPRVSTDTSTTKVPADSMRVVLVPASAKEVAGLVPGMRFTGTVDTRTGDSSRVKLVSMAG